MYVNKNYAVCSIFSYNSITKNNFKTVFKFIKTRFIFYKTHTISCSLLIIVYQKINILYVVFIILTTFWFHTICLKWEQTIFYWWNWAKIFVVLSASVFSFLAFFNFLIILFLFGIWLFLKIQLIKLWDKGARNFLKVCSFYFC